jgi:hypothetical protein
MISVSSRFSPTEDHVTYKSGFEAACGDKIKAIQQSFMVIQKHGETLLDVLGLQSISLHVFAHHVRHGCLVMLGPHTVSRDRV